ncbi:hypothetical protein LOTGIDRAFT_231447 [Lottia gigantea]|uniref:Methyltransferase domain-containing protein n=1 Tax=Lottia gigantea TaxID=225164 RepID=V4A3I6_LOTGI|nr:hypothetical protein LOTGIDRAFT_231447 [Lottia gigantea]ESO98408.1 hypothetical protein LOTGIDRAFT_231447 [Lottia gigantea]
MNFLRSLYILLIAFFIFVFLFVQYQPLRYLQTKSVDREATEMKKEKDSMLQEMKKEKDSMLQELKKEKENRQKQMKDQNEDMTKKITITKPKEPTVPQNIGVKDLCTLLDKGIQVDSWWKYVCLIERNIDKPLGYNCKNAKNMGNWKVCFDEKYSPIRPDKPCLVYSFGIAWDFTFDIAMAKEGCEVYSFDPRKPQVWKTRTLRSVMKMLHHENRVIDVLKFDIELAEWKVMINIIKDGMLPQIRQLLTEWHIFPGAPKRDELKTFYEMHRDLPSHGLETFFKTGHARQHSDLLKFNSQAESCYINVKFTDSK